MSSPTPRDTLVLAVPVAVVLALLVCTPADAGGAAHPAEAVRAAPVAAAPRTTHVVIVSVDGLNPRALTRLGSTRLPRFFRLIARGSHTLNARTEAERTETLPNHVSMVTGRRINVVHRGHGVTWNRHRAGTTVQRAAGHWVSSAFSRVASSGRSTAVFATKPKFSIFERSWPHAVDRSYISGRQWRVVRRATGDLVRHRRALTFLHLSLPDRAGHAHGGMSLPYLDAVRRTDRQLGVLLRGLDHHPRLKRHTSVVLTSDHGFTRVAERHDNRRLLANNRIPFTVWGAGATSANLYRINPGRRDPGNRRPWYSGRQPVRNGDAGNVATRLLGIGNIPGSTIGRFRTLHTR